MSGCIIKKLSKQNLHMHEIRTLKYLVSTTCDQLTQNQDWAPEKRFDS